jgi:hypothetical protein
MTAKTEAEDIADLALGFHKLAVAFKSMTDLLQKSSIRETQISKELADLRLEIAAIKFSRDDSAL